MLFSPTKLLSTHLCKNFIKCLSENMYIIIIISKWAEIGVSCEFMQCGKNVGVISSLFGWEGRVFWGWRLPLGSAHFLTRICVGLSNGWWWRGSRQKTKKKKDDDEEAEQWRGLSVNKIMVIRNNERKCWFAIVFSS